MLMAVSEAAFHAPANDAWGEAVRLAERIARRVDGGEAILARLALASSQPLAGRDHTAERDDLSRIEAVEAPDMQGRTRAHGASSHRPDGSQARPHHPGSAHRARGANRSGRRPMVYEPGDRRPAVHQPAYRRLPPAQRVSETAGLVPGRPDAAGAGLRAAVCSSGGSAVVRGPAATDSRPTSQALG